MSTEEGTRLRELLRPLECSDLAFEGSENLGLVTRHRVPVILPEEHVRVVLEVGIPKFRSGILVLVPGGHRISYAGCPTDVVGTLITSVRGRSRVYHLHQGVIIVDV